MEYSPDTTRSARPSPVRSPRATCVTPLKFVFGPEVISASRAKSPPRKTRARGPLWLVPTATSATPSPVTSPTATATGPVYEPSPRVGVERTAPVTPSMTRTRAARLLVPAVVATTSATPSPVTSPTATRTAPV